MRRLIVLCIALLPAWPDSAKAQASSQVGPGARVRITVPELRPYTGTLLALSADTLVLHPENDGDTLRIPVTSVTRLDVSGGRQSRIGSGIKYGVLAGSLTGLVVGAITCADLVDSCSAASSEEGDQTVLYVLGGALVGGVGGVIVGGAIGAAASGERWDQASPDRWHLSVVPRTHGGVTLAVSVRF